MWIHWNSLSISVCLLGSTVISGGTWDVSLSLFFSQSLGRCLRVVGPGLRVPEACFMLTWSVIGAADESSDPSGSPWPHRLGIQSPLSTLFTLWFWLEMSSNTKATVYVALIIFLFPGRAQALSFITCTLRSAVWISRRGSLPFIRKKLASGLEVPAYGTAGAFYCVSETHQVGD